MSDRFDEPGAEGEVLFVCEIKLLYLAARDQGNVRDFRLWLDETSEATHVAVLRSLDLASPSLFKFQIGTRVTSDIDGFF